MMLFIWAAIIMNIPSVTISHRRTPYDHLIKKIKHSEKHPAFNVKIRTQLKYFNNSVINLSFCKKRTYQYFLNQAENFNNIIFLWLLDSHITAWSVHFVEYTFWSHPLDRDLSLLEWHSQNNHNKNNFIEISRQGIQTFIANLRLHHAKILISTTSM